ncbi:hypothetical protein [Blautia sp. LMAG:36]|uniref:hypothetical protein n=1 Tax=Blautia sp. LMAG:36 TaxID=1969168 RepID=UPI00257E1A7B|nr:hypothetical protein [Blautia sp. LMAG:36]
MEGKQAIKFDKYNSQAMKGIAIVIMLFHHMYLSQDRFEGLNVVFTPFSADRIMYLCRTFKICDRSMHLFPDTDCISVTEKIILHLASGQPKD